MNRQDMESHFRKLLHNLFIIPETEKIAVKKIRIHSEEDEENIQCSLDASYHDCCSDVDVHVFLRNGIQREDGAEKLSPGRKYFRRIFRKEDVLGVSFGARTRLGEGMEEVCRVCLENGFRTDLIFHTENGEEACGGTDRDKEAKDACGNTDRDKEAKEACGGPDRDGEAADAFWFCAVQALGKLMRGDYLIADHLAHSLIMDGLVLQMAERDREYQTNFHRYGHRERLVYRETAGDWEEYCAGDASYRHIAQNLCRAVTAYEELAAGLHQGYGKRLECYFRLWRSYIQEGGRA